MSEALWPAARAADAVEALARAAGFAPRAAARATAPARWPDAPSPTATPAQFARFIEDTAAFVGVEAEPLDVRHGGVDRTLAGAAPALVVVGGAAGDQPRLLAWVGTRRGHLRVVGPTGPLLMSKAHARRLLCGPSEAEVGVEIDALLAGAHLAGALRRRARLRAALTADRLHDHSVARGYTLGDPPSVGLRTAVRRLHLAGRLGLLLGLHTLQYGLGLVGWAIVGRAALAGRLDGRGLALFVALRLALIPPQVLATWMSGALAIDGGVLIKRRLLFGALALDPEDVRQRGVGRFLGVVYESSAVEKLGLGGGFAAVLALIELCVSAVVLAFGAGGIPQTLSLVAWTGAGVALGAAYLRRRQGWTDGRLALTYDLVERLVGHRTRLAQEDPLRRHDEEDAALAAYFACSRGLDGAQVLLGALLPWGWLVIGVGGLLVAFVIAPAGAESAGRLATGLGGVLLAQRALARLGDGLTQIAGAVVAWREVKPLFAAAVRPPLVGAPLGEGDRDEGAPSSADGVVAEAREVTFRYGDRGGAPPILRGASLTVRTGERLLLHGASGGGKSTLASLLAGLRTPTSGVVLAGGLDRATLGMNGWRRRVVTAPQFHENHVFSASLAFNLLLGRSWPPERGDIEEAEAVCRELDLGPVLDRMPAGLAQMIGETGWQLSHGERSRLFIARALLQSSDLLLLDESFAALDPPTLDRAMSCVLRRARALLIIAHP